MCLTKADNPTTNYFFATIKEAPRIETTAYRPFYLLLGPPCFSPTGPAA